MPIIAVPKTAKKVFTKRSKNEDLFIFKRLHTPEQHFQDVGIKSYTEL